MSRTGRRLLIAGILAVAVVSAVYVLVSGTGMGAVGTRADTIGIIRVEGAIVGGASTSGLLGGMVGADDLMSQLMEAREDPSVRAVVLRVNSPGGSAAASQEIGAEVKKLREAGKPVVASMGDTAASGGYWVASQANHIMASPATMTGSIGVILQVTNLQGLYEKLGLEVETFKSGEHKDMGSGNRPVSEAEEALFQGMIDDIFDQFVDVVATGRGLSREEVLAVADGRLFTGRQALAAGLVDSLGNFQESIEKAAELAGLEDYEVRDLRRPRPLESWLGLLGWEGLPAGLRLEEPRIIRWALFPERS